MKVKGDAVLLNSVRAADPDNRRQLVYTEVCAALMSGHFVPGQKITIRALASAYGTSLTPVREALHRLVAEGVLEGEANRSVRVPVVTGAKLRELRDIRLAVEPLAAARAAERIPLAEIVQLRGIADELRAAREKGDVATDIDRLTEFQFKVYRASEMPTLMRTIEGLWLQTGPYLKLLYPGYVRQLRARRGDWRERLCSALERRDAEAARREIQADVGEALDYLATLADAASFMGPRTA